MDLEKTAEVIIKFFAEKEIAIDKKYLMEIVEEEDGEQVLLDFIRVLKIEPVFTK